jgi:hypothetical protein
MCAVFAFKCQFILSSILMWVLDREGITVCKLIKVRDYVFVTIHLACEFKVKFECEGKNV